MTAAPARLLAGLRTGLFGTRANTLVTLATLLLLSQVVPPLFR